MQVLRSIWETLDWALTQKRSGLKIGLVPTMGYLHEGHLTLVRQARQACDRVIVSIFVNPTQFGPGEDYDDYPRDLERDCALLEGEGTDAVFAPAVTEMYPEGYNTYVEAFGEITEKLCARSRPHHFRGVTTVVSKLFNICVPDIAFFGWKDAQQLLIIKKMVRELNFPLEVRGVDIVREADGLALSSRNVYLSPQNRTAALVLSRSLQLVRERIEAGERDALELKSWLRASIEKQPPAVIDYVEIVETSELKDIEQLSGQVLIAVAVKFDKTRLIDNIMVEV